MSRRPVKKTLIDDESGYTVVELLIAMQLAFLVIVFAFWGFGFTTKILNRWSSDNQAAMQKTLTNRALLYSLDKIREIKVAQPHYLEAITTAGDKLVISLSDDQLVVNGKVLSKGFKGGFRYCLDAQNGGDIQQLSSVLQPQARNIRIVKLNGAASEDGFQLHITTRPMFLGNVVTSE